MTVDGDGLRWIVMAGLVQSPYSSTCFPPRANRPPKALPNALPPGGSSKHCRWGWRILASDRLAFKANCLTEL